MASIIEILYERYIEPYKRSLLILIIFIIFALAGYYAYKWYAVPKINNVKTSDMANYNGRTSEARVLFFTADWCPHCKRAAPQWEKFQESYNGKIIGNYELKTESVDCSSGDNPLITQYSIDGYPTCILVKDENQRIDFDAKITENNLAGFVNSVLK